MALGILSGMVFYWRTGISCGGIITPGVIALSLNQPLRLLYALALSILVWLVLELLSRVITLYGRQRIALAMFIALVCRILIGEMVDLSPVMLGWAVPGLMAADFQRQGVCLTLSAVLSNSIIAGILYLLLSNLLQGRCFS